MAALWVWSHFRSNQIVYRHLDRQFRSISVTEVSSNQGECILIIRRWSWDTPEAFDYGTGFDGLNRGWSFRSGNVDSPWIISRGNSIGNMLGFSAGTGGPAIRAGAILAKSFGIAMPDWFVMLLFVCLAIPAAMQHYDRIKTAWSRLWPIARALLVSHCMASYAALIVTVVIQAWHFDANVIKDQIWWLIIFAPILSLWGISDGLWILSHDPADRIFVGYIAAAYALAFALVIWQFHRREWIRRKIIDGICVTCGYDLRATPDRCPECGTIPPRSKLVAG